MVPDESGPQPEDETAPGAVGEPALLPGLWLVCVVFGLGAVLFVTLLFLATPLGRAMFGLLAAASVALALGLWVRSNAARWGAIGVVGLACALLVVDFAMEPFAPGYAVHVLGVCIGFSVMLYLLVSGTAFKDAREPRPRLATWRFAAAAGAVVLLGGGAMYVALADEPVQEFPRLQWEPLSVPGDQNAFYLLEEMMGSHPLEDDEDLEAAFKRREEAPAECLTLAREVVERHREALERASEVSAMRGYAPPVPETSSEWLDVDWECMGYCRWLGRLMSLQSDILVAEGQAAAAMHTAAQVVKLGRTLARDNMDLLGFLMGVMLVQMGADQVRRVAASPVSDVLVAGQGRRAHAALHGTVHEALAVGEAVRHGFRQGLAAELHFTTLMLREGKGEPVWLTDLGVPQTGLLPTRLLGVRLLRDCVPLVKVNMTRNLMARYLQPVLRTVEHYEPLKLPDISEPKWWAQLRGRPSPPLAGLRNLVGRILASHLPVAPDRMVKEAMGAIAEARATCVFLALRAYHADRDQLPAELDALVPDYLEELPPDPFTHDAFIYQPDATPPTLISPAGDLKLEPGAERTDDICLELSFATR